MRDRHAVLIWVVVGAVAAGVLGWAFPRVFPLFPDPWRLSKAEAETVVLERLRDLGAPVSNPYVVTTLETRTVLEQRLRTSGAQLDPERLRQSEMARDVFAWQVTVFAAGDSPKRWRYRARVTPSGEVTALRRRVGEDEEVDSLALEVARARAAAFLTDAGFDLAAYDPPQPRTVELESHAEVFLRYRSREALLGPDYPYGLEVIFAGDRLSGYQYYYEDPGEAAFKQDLQPMVLLNQFWVFVTLLLLPLVAIPFVRRYHAGEVGVGRGLQILLVALAGSTLVTAFCARIVSAGWSIDVLTRQQLTWAVSLQMFALFFLPLGLLAFLSWSVGESLCRERWSAKLAAFDAFFKRDWQNATFARAALRGTAAGLAIVAGLWLFDLGAGRWGVWTPQAFLLGPWWEAASWFSIPMVAFHLTYGLYVVMFAKLFLVSASVRRLGVRMGGLVATVLGAFLYFPPQFVFPLHWSPLVWILASGVLVVLFLRYGLFTAFLAHLTASVVSSAVPLLGTEDPSMQLQASLALLVVGLPLAVSFRSVLSARSFLYRYEDVPPHVRRIAERERQRVELETARRIQGSILPQLPPLLAGVRIAHAYLPATEVGGDFYDVLALEDGRLAAAVGDVAGHGVSSGLVMSMAKSALAVQVTFEPEVEAVFTTLNRVLFQSARKRLLATLCYVLVDPERRQLSYASAGHLFPYRIGLHGETEALESIAYPLGVRRDMAVRVRQTRLDAGDSLFLFSDGVVEARPDTSDELFGFPRLEASLARHAGAGPEALRDGVLADVAAFAGTGPRDDDLTVLVLQLPVD